MRDKQNCSRTVPGNRIKKIINRTVHDKSAGVKWKLLFLKACVLFWRNGLLTFLYLLTLRNTLAIRVNDLAPFREIPEPGRRKIPVEIPFSHYRTESGTWLAWFAFRIVVKSPLEGVIYLNPRQAAEFEMLKQLSRQQDAFVFCYATVDMKDA